MKKKDGVWKYWDISTGHMTRTDNNILLGGHSTGLIYLRDKGAGYWILIPFGDDLDVIVPQFREQGFSEEFCNLLIEAPELGCYWIHIHADGNSYEDLPWFDW